LTKNVRAGLHKKGGEKFSRLFYWTTNKLFFYSLLTIRFCPVKIITGACQKSPQ